MNTRPFQPRVRPALVEDRLAIAEMRVALWPEGSFEEHLKEVDASFVQWVPSTLPGVTLVSVDEHGVVTGFVDAGLRSHADGCDPAQPVGYIEGWFVNESHRGRGIGSALIRAAEEWARAQGCVEMASDVLIDNEVSQRAHTGLGYEVVDRCVHSRKRL